MSYTSQEKAIVEQELIRLRYELGVPIDEVVDRISGNPSSATRGRGGFVKYSQLIEEAKKQNPFAPKTSSPGSENPTGLEPNDALQSLTTAVAEAIIYGQLRDRRSVFGTPSSLVFHDPVAQGTEFINNLSQPFQFLGQQALKSFGVKTPDILLISAPQTGVVGNRPTTEYPIWSDQLDLNNPKSTTLLTSPPIDKILVSPVEITISKKPDYIKKKIEKFGEYKAEIISKNPNARYLPVLVLDYSQYMSIKDSQKKLIAKAMKGVGGIIVLRNGLLDNASAIAKAAVARFTPQIRQLNGLSAKPTPSAARIALAAKINAQQKSSLSQLFTKPKEWFQSLTQKSPLSNGLEEPVQKESAAETYKRVTSNIKSNSSFFQKVGVVNSEQIDLVIASNAIKSGLDPVKLLKQSPTYQAKMPVLNKMWLNKIVHDANGISKEEPNSANFQKTIKKYDTKKTKAQSNQQAATNTSPTKRLASDVYQEMTLSLKETASYPEKAGIDIVNNTNHLDLMLAKQLVMKDVDYEKILKQSPNYRSKEPAEANLWLKNIIKDGICMNKEYYLDSTGSQKMIRSYDNDASRPPEKSSFEKLSDSAQRYNSSYSTDREGLLVAVATAAIKAGMNPEQVLRQDPRYSANEKGEALVEKTIEKAESAVQAEKSRAEQQAERDSQRDRGYER